MRLLTAAVCKIRITAI